MYKQFNFWVGLFLGCVKNDRTGPPESTLSRSTLGVLLCYPSCASDATVRNSLQEKLPPVVVCGGRESGAFSLFSCKKCCFKKTVNSTSEHALGVDEIIERGPHKHEQSKPPAGPTDMVCRSRCMSSTAAVDS